MHETPPRAVLAFDFGVRQIGVAMGQTLTAGTRRLPELRAREGQPRWEQVEALLADWQPDLLLVGLPLNMDGTESEFCRRARKFARRLEGRFGIRTLMVDERLSTREARERGGPRESYRSDPVDSIAAEVILETWLGDPDCALVP